MPRSTRHLAIAERHSDNHRTGSVGGPPQPAKELASVWSAARREERPPRRFGWGRDITAPVPPSRKGGLSASMSEGTAPRLHAQARRGYRKEFESLGLPFRDHSWRRIASCISSARGPGFWHGYPQTCLAPAPQTGYSPSMDYSKIITIEPGKRSGKPCIRGLRITVADVLEYLASGMSESQILADFPELSVEDIRACLAFAAERERRILAHVA